VITPGEVRLVYFPFSHSEAEPYKKRPVLVLASHGTPPDQAVLVAMITGSAARVARPHPGDIVLTDWQRMRLDKPSVIRTRRIWTAEARDFTGNTLGAVGVDVLEAVKEQVRRTLD